MCVVNVLLHITLYHINVQTTSAPLAHIVCIYILHTSVLYIRMLMTKLKASMNENNKYNSVSISRYSQIVGNEEMSVNYICVETLSYTQCDLLIYSF